MPTEKNALRQAVETNWPAETRGVLLALSGGPDSMALLDALLPVCAERGIPLQAACVDHGLRPESAEEVRFVAAYCASVGVVCHERRVDVEKEARAHGEGVEAAGRRARYDFFQCVMQKEGLNCLALAHHMDDQAETVLLNLARGSGLAGLRGMAVYAPPCWRPLLGVRKEELLDYVDGKGIPYCIDQSNDSAQYTRNRMRKLLREWESIHPAAVANTARGAALMQTDEAFLSSEAERAACAAWNPEKKGLMQDALRLLHPAIVTRVLRQYARRCGLESDFETVHVEAIIALLPKRDGIIHLPRGYWAHVSAGILRMGDEPLSSRIDVESDKEIPLRLGRNETRRGTIIAERIQRPTRLGEAWPCAVEADPAALVGATIRPWRAGDWMRPLGMKGKRKKLQDIWVDKKIPRGERLRPLVCDDDEVLLVPGVAVSERLNAADCEWVWRVRLEEPEENEEEEETSCTMKSKERC